MTGAAEFFSEHYLNPVYPASFPDPFVLKFRGEYFAYCTGHWRDGKVFGVLHSRDLVEWREIGGAMDELESGAPFYWAPEVTYHNGKFYLYYSVGNETLMELRVAVSTRPDGGFVDAGRKLTTEDFAIDAHVFEDTDGTRYFFYATDFLTHSHIGTGTVVDRMVDWFTLEGKPRPVTRARYDWQVYDPQRKEKGGVRWHTVEGSFVLKRKGTYYEMFSCGNWQNPTYGVSFAVTDDIDRDEEWLQFSDGEKVLPILRTIPGVIVGPGHNSVIRGVNNRELYCVYHRWTEQGRVLAIDRMDFAGGGRIFIHGATHTPQPAPFKPQVHDFFDELSDDIWEIRTGSWRVADNQITSGGEGRSEILCRARADSFLAETWLRSAGQSGRYGVSLQSDGTEVFSFEFDPGGGRALAVRTDDPGQTQSFPLPADFDFEAFHHLRLEADHSCLRVSLDDNAVRFEQMLSRPGTQIALLSEEAPAAFSGLALTVGFEDLFENEDLAARGWSRLSESGSFRVDEQHLILTGEGAAPALIGKTVPEGNYELVVNIRLEKTLAEDGTFGILPGFDDVVRRPLFLFEKLGEQWTLRLDGLNESRQLDLPGMFLPGVFHQFRFLKIDNQVVAQLETEVLGITAVPRIPAVVALMVDKAVVSVDLVRLTLL